MKKTESRRDYQEERIKKRESKREIEKTKLIIKQSYRDAEELEYEISELEKKKSVKIAHGDKDLPRHLVPHEYEYALPSNKHRSSS